MITGFNTDIERDGVVYHVQTEDKGLDSPLILSLVYSGGEILAAKRTTYEDLIAAGFNDEVLAERLKRQHRLICAAINAGRIDDLKRMSSRADGVAPEAIGPGADGEPGQAPADGASQVIHDEFEIELDPERPPVTDRPYGGAIGVHDEFEIELDAEIRDRPLEIHEEFIIETAAERPPVVDWPPKVEEVVTETSAEESQIGAGLPTDQETFETPGSLAPQETAYTLYDSRGPSRGSRKPQADLVLTILNDEEFRAGETVIIRVLLQACLGETEKPLGGVPLSVKVLGTTFRPRLYHVNTQRDGIGIVSVEIPPFTSGRAAVLIRAEAHEQSIELRRAIQPAD